MSAKVTRAMYRALRALRDREKRGLSTTTTTLGGDGFRLGSYRAWDALIARGFVCKVEGTTADLVTTAEGYAYLERSQPPGTEEPVRGPWEVVDYPQLDGESPRAAAERWCEAQRERGRRTITLRKHGHPSSEVRLSVALVWKVVE